MLHRLSCVAHPCARRLLYGSVRVVYSAMTYSSVTLALLLATPAAARHAPNPAQLAKRIHRLQGAIRSEHYARLRRAIRDLEKNTPIDRDAAKELHKQLGQLETAKTHRTRVKTHPARAYRKPRRGKYREPSEKEAKPPKVPTRRGLFAREHWRRFTPERRSRALGLTKRNSWIAKESPQHLPIAEFDGIRRMRQFYKQPRYIDGVIAETMGRRKATELTRRLDELMQLTERGTQHLFADRVTLLYPDTPITPKDVRHFDTAYRDLLEDAAFVFVQSYEFTKADDITLINNLADQGVPVYAVVGDAPPDSPAAKAWSARSSNVNFVESHQENQGSGREYRIDHNKGLFVVKKDGSVACITGGINRNELSHYNIDMAQLLEGGNVGLDVLGGMLRDYLRAGGRIRTKDFKRRQVAKAIEHMIKARRKNNAVSIEVAATSSAIMGYGEELTVRQIRARLRRGTPLYISGGAFAQSLPAIGIDTYAAAAKNGQRIVVIQEPDIDANHKSILKERDEALRAAGVEITQVGALMIDNSIENLVFDVLDRSARDGENVTVASFANSSGNTTRKIIETSKALRSKRKTLTMLSADLQIDREINAGANAKMLYSEDFRGHLMGVRDIPGPTDERGGRKLHGKLLVVHGTNDGKETGGYFLASSNLSRHGLEVNEERGMFVKSAPLAKELRAFLLKAKRRYGERLVPPHRFISNSKIKRRQSLTKRIVGRDTPLSDVVFIVLDYETDGFDLRHDTRPIEIAARAYSVGADGKSIREITAKVPSAFERLIHMGKDLYGREKQLADEISELTSIEASMLAYQEGLVPVTNDLVAWIRTVERQTGKTVVLTGHNLYAFDKRILNECCAVRGVRGNPYVDGDVADTLRASEKMRPGEPKSLQVLAEALGIDCSKFAMHRGTSDIIVTKLVFERQLKELAKTRGVKISDLRWGDIRDVFIPKTQAKHESDLLELGELPLIDAEFGLRGKADARQVLHALGDLESAESNEAR